MFRYASRRFGLTLFIATAMDTPRRVPPAPLTGFSLFLSLSLSLSHAVLARRRLARVYRSVHRARQSSGDARDSIPSRATHPKRATQPAPRPILSSDLFVYRRSTISSDLYVPRVPAS